MIPPEEPGGAAEINAAHSAWQVVVRLLLGYSPPGSRARLGSDWGRASELPAVMIAGSCPGASLPGGGAQRRLVRGLKAAEANLARGSWDSGG